MGFLRYRYWSLYFQECCHLAVVASPNSNYNYKHTLKSVVDPNFHPMFTSLHLVHQPALRTKPDFQYFPFQLYLTITLFLQLIHFQSSSSYLNVHSCLATHARYYFHFLGQDQPQFPMAFHHRWPCLEHLVPLYSRFIECTLPKNFYN